MDFPDQTLRDRTAVFEVLADELERLPVVQQIPHVVGIGLGNRLPIQQSLGLLQSQACSFDVRGVVCFQDQGAAAHLTHPAIGQSRLPVRCTQTGVPPGLFSNIAVC